MKTMAQQIKAMRQYWPAFDVIEEPTRTLWFGPLVGIERLHRIMVEYGQPSHAESDELWRQFPLVRVLSPRLILRFDAHEEAPLPHVYFDEHDPTLSALCLFDPETREWSHNDLIALTTIPWAADWIACYEGWLATGWWHGGGRHATNALRQESAR